jgi:UDP-2,3-diacylglucosamine pyrophosphatase LpxH
MKIKTLFLSDIHLGTKFCQARKLLQLLKSLESEDGKQYNVENLFLIGDIIDFEHLNRKNEWAHEHWQVIQKFLRMSRKGVNVVYISGNHDLAVSWLKNQSYGNIMFKDSMIYTVNNGRKYLLLHGHQFDTAIHSMPWLYWLGDTSYTIALYINSIFSSCRSLFGYKSEWSLSHWLKSKVKQVVKYASDYEKLVVKYCEKYGCEGIILGHIHIAANHNIENIHYLNCGAWVEMCTAVVEYHDGTMELITL